MMRCNCSICTKNGYYLVYPLAKDVVFHQGEDHLKSYRFGNQKAEHRFCPTCGSSVLINANHGEKLAMNVSYVRVRSGRGGCGGAMESGEMLMLGRLVCSKGWRSKSSISRISMGGANYSRRTAFDGSDAVAITVERADDMDKLGVTDHGVFVDGPRLTSICSTRYLFSFVSMTKCPKLTVNASPSFDGFAA